MLDTILRNYLGNAIKFSPAGSSIFINVQFIDQYAQVEVKDLGVGIAPAQRAEIFLLTSTYKTDGTQSEQGTGLGLKIVAEFTKQLKAEIGVESEVNLGSTFWIKIPLHP